MQLAPVLTSLAVSVLTDSSQWPDFITVLGREVIETLCPPIQFGYNIL